MSKSESQSEHESESEPALRGGVSPGRRPSFTAAHLVTDLIDLTADYPLKAGKCLKTIRVFVRIPGIQESGYVPIQSETMRMHLRSLSEQKLGRGPVSSVIDDVIAHIEAKGFALPPSPMFRRVAHHAGVIYIDRGTPSGEAIRIAADGVSIESDPPVLFDRSDQTGTLPQPRRGGDLALFRSHFPSCTEEGSAALLGFIISCYLPEGAYPILMVQGPHGCGKSTLTELLRALVDPTEGFGGRGTLPDNAEDVATVVGASFLPSFDNASRIPPEVADTLCRASTGGVHQSRKLYTQGETHVLSIHSPVIINSISLPLNRQDLVSRVVLLDLEALEDDARRTELAIRDRFNADLPKLLGYIFEGVAQSLRDFGGTILRPLPRLADAAQFATAAEPALGLADGSIAEAWDGSQLGQSAEQVASDPVIHVLKELLSTSSAGFECTASELLERAHAWARLQSCKLPPDFPQSASRLGSELRRNASLFERAGLVVVQPKRTNTRRTWSVAPASNQIPSARRFTVQRSVIVDVGQRGGVHEVLHGVTEPLSHRSATAGYAGEMSLGTAA